MAKADFCFNFYDGDATRDMAHMNRLERGAYTDVIIQQRQRGHLSINDLKKFLSKDFDTVWPALEWILKKDAAGLFFIEWLETSEKKAKAHSVKQSENRAKALKKEPKSNQQSTKRQPKDKSGQPLVEPLGNGDGNGNELKIKKESKIIFPFTSDKFLRVWDVWKKYRSQIRKPYRSELSEQTALKKLSEYDESTAIQMIENSIANQWQGIFELDKKQNGPPDKRQQTITSLREAFAKQVIADNSG
jgi:hypothetical protein